MASLGALATVMTALTGFFSQQLLLFEDCAQRTDTAIVRLARTNNYTAAGGILGPGTGGNWMLWAEYAPMVAATTVGLIQPIEDFTNVFARGCDSGNCTFPSSDGASFSTVAISHICEDISGLIRQYTNYSHTSTVLTTPEGAPTRLNYSDHRNYSDFSVMTTSTHATKYRGHDLFPLHTITLLFRERFASNDSRAVNCTLFPTVNTYSVKVANTRLEETLLESIPLDFDYPDITTNLAGGEEEGLEWRPNLFALATDYTMRDGIKEPCAGSADPAPELVKHYKVKTEEWDEEGKIHRTSTQWYYPKDCLWTMSQPAAWGLRRHFDTMFHEQILKSNGLSLIEGNAYLRALWRQDPEGRENMTGPPIKGQTSIASIDESFRNMTRAMTAFIRTHGAEGEEGWARGYMWANTTCAYVRWEWIAFPVVMIALTGLFLLLVIIDNWKVESDRLWKSSVLATLFCEVDVERDRPKGKEEMSEIAKSTGVSLEGKSGRLRMVVRE